MPTAASARSPAYYFIDDYTSTTRIPVRSPAPAFPASMRCSSGAPSYCRLGDNKLIGSNTVNEFHLGYLRNANVIGQPKGGLGVSMASQGFVRGPARRGSMSRRRSLKAWKTSHFLPSRWAFPSPTRRRSTTHIISATASPAVIGAHTFKVGGQFHIDQVNDYPNGTFNGTFNINGTETGDPYADLLLGVASNFTQSSGSPFYLRNRYSGRMGRTVGGRAAI